MGSLLKRLFLLVFSVALGVAPLALPMGAGAAGKPLDLSMSPLPINLSTAPGTKVSADLRVKQGGPGTARLQVKLMKFTAHGEEGKPALEERGPGDDYFDWVKFDKQQFDAPANEWQTVKMTINVPKSAAFGYYYAVQFTRVGDDSAPGGNVNALNGGIATLVLLEAYVPNAKRQVAVDSFQSVHRFYEFLPSAFKVKFANTGNVHVVPHGTIFIMSGKKQVASLTMNEAQGNILPNTKRIYDVNWLDGFPHAEEVVVDGKAKMDKKGHTMSHLVWSNGGDGAKSAMPHLRMGYYTAKLFAVYDDGGRDVPIEASVSFWVIPWRFLLAVLAVAALAGLGVFASVRGGLRGIRRLGKKRR